MRHKADVTSRRRRLVVSYRVYTTWMTAARQAASLRRRRRRRRRHPSEVPDRLSLDRRSPLGHRPTAVQRRLTSFSFGKETTAGVSVEIDPELTATAAALTVDRAGRCAVISFVGRLGRQRGQSAKIVDERR